MFIPKKRTKFVVWSTISEENVRFIDFRCYDGTHGTYSNKCSLLLLLIWLWFWLHVLLMEPSCSEYMHRDNKN